MAHLTCKYFDGVCDWIDATAGYHIHRRNFVSHRLLTRNPGLSKRSESDFFGHSPICMEFQIQATFEVTAPSYGANNALSVSFPLSCFVSNIRVYRQVRFESN